MKITIARTVKDLIEVLSTKDPTMSWHGDDDECIYLTKDGEQIEAIDPNNFEEGYL